MKWPAVCGFVVGTILLARSLPTTFAFDKPVHTSIVLLATIAAAVIGLSKYLPRDEGRSLKGQQYDTVPLEELDHLQPSREQSPAPNTEDVRYPSSLRKLRIFFLLLVIATCLRVELLREIVANTQCMGSSWTPIIPFAFALWDYWTVQRHKKGRLYEDPNGSVYDALEQHLINAPYRYILAVLLVGFGSIVATSTTRSPDSTFICATTLPHRWIVPKLQHCATILDVLTIFCVGQLLRLREGRGARGLALRFMSVGWASLFSALVLSFTGTVYYIMSEPDRKWIMSIPSVYFWSVIKLDALVCFTAVCGLMTVHYAGLLTTSLIATFVSVSASTTSNTWINPHPFPPISMGLAFVAICLVILGFAIYFHLESLTGEQGESDSPVTFSKVPSWFYLCLLVLFFIRAGLWASSSNSVAYHPIDLLIYEAQTVHETYLNQTSASKTLSEAAQTYRERYHRPPPPGFQHWYDYATARKSVVIDNFDGINNDITPFFSQSPQEIRQRTWQMISNPWNDAAGISVRDGKVSISPNVVPTHRWMLDGIVDMIGHFAEWLPDMDLAFNLNDECRVAVPFKEFELMQHVAKDSWDLASQPKNAFSGQRGEQWAPIPDPPNSETSLKELSFQRTFYDFGSIGCPPGSPARSQRIWNVNEICTECTAPQSLGAFLANWTIAADICHQPDLANLHGLYTSPAAFKGSHELFPVFSQSKAHGFNDILYPSAWNYIDKAKYDPSPDHPDMPFTEKINTTFWRGATSEGVSPGMGQWKGMTRQRFIHLANDVHDAAPPQALLLPHRPTSYDKRDKFTYTTLPTSQLAQLISTDIHLVDVIVRCGGRDCPDQAAEFAPLVPPSDFQAHWQYKYLLDLDGAGFSGRFLPFLASRSLPLKAALFREWWDDRVTAWQHFVPLDVRGHGFWATLAYFAGVDGVVHGKTAEVKAHHMEGERIAESGREWAAQVLRKEDMEIYFFRLLLEWGRLTDDNRDAIGYDGR